MNILLKRNGIVFGVILGILLALPTIIAYSVDINYLVNDLMFPIIILMVIIVGIICISFAKKKLQGIIGFKEAFSTYLIMLVVSVLIFNSFNFLLFNVIDKPFQEVVKEKTIENINVKFQEVKDNPDISEEDLNTYQERTTNTIQQIKEENLYSITALFKGFATYIALFSIFGLLLSMILKSK